MRESARFIPVAYDVDVVVVGGSTAAVATAVAAAGEGCRVFLAASRTYLGEDLCSTLRLWHERGKGPETTLAGRLFADPAGPDPLTPMHIKRVLDEALLDAGVEFLFGCFVSDVLRDAAGEPAGIVMANRNGRQAVKAKVIIDATPRATVARLAGAEATPYPAGDNVFTRVVIGGRPALGVPHRELPVRAQGPDGTRYPIHEYTLTLSMKDASFASFARAEQAARDLTFHTGQVDDAEDLWQLPPDTIVGETRGAEPVTATDVVDIAALRPRGIPHLYVLGGCADVARDTVRELLRPPNFIALGESVGRAVAADATSRSVPTDARVLGERPKPGEKMDVAEPLNGVRPTDTGLPSVVSGDRDLPVLGVYDVVVVGGGTAGAPAAISAARDGARTLLVEPLHGLGGVSTLGMIGKYYHGYRGGFTAEIDAGVEAVCADVSIIGKSEWYRREIRKADGEIWFGAIGCGAVVDGDTVRGVVVVTPAGRGVVLAGAVVDATGNADIAAAAGAQCVYVDDTSAALQGSGLPPRDPGRDYTNTDYTFADDSDLLDTWRMFVVGRQRFRSAYDLGQLLDTRERRRIIAEFVLSPLDHIVGRTYPDTIMIAKSNFDSHGYTVHPLFLLDPPDRDELTVHVPYRCLLPEGVKGVLVTGLAIGAHRDAMPIVRMQPDVQNQGYAAGLAAARAARDGVDVDEVDIRAIQHELIQKGCLPESVLNDDDSVYASAAHLEDAIERVVDQYDGLATILAWDDEALPMLRVACARAESAEHRLVCAHILGMLGEPAGAHTLANAIAASEWDEGWNYKGMGQFGSSMSRLDSLIVALGHTRAECALEPILTKAGQLKPSHEFSHHRAVAMALETLAAPKAAPILAAVLRQPGMTGHCITKEAIAREFSDTDPCSNMPRTESLRELVLARALYRCGDRDGLGERILREYTGDVHGLYARHACAVIKAYETSHAHTE